MQQGQEQGEALLDQVFPSKYKINEGDKEKISPAAVSRVKYWSRN